MRYDHLWGHVNEGVPLFRVIQRGNYRPRLEYIGQSNKKLKSCWFVESESEAIYLPENQDALIYCQYLNGERVYA